MSGAAAFLTGFAGGIQRKQDNALRQDMLDTIAASRPAPITGGPKGTDFIPQGGQGGGTTPAQSGSTPAQGLHKPYATQDPVAEGLAPHQKAFLNAVAGGESDGRYDIRYTPKGGATFEGFDQHPGIFEEGPHGPSSAAGRYQFTKSTWDEMGGGRFDPSSQDQRAWTLAEKRYLAKTGRSLDADLQSSGLTNDMMGALTPTWQAFGKNQGRHIATYNDSLRRYGAAGGPVQTAAATETAKPAPRPQGFTALGIKATPEEPFVPQAWGKLREYMKV